MTDGVYYIPSRDRIITLESVYRIYDEDIFADFIVGAYEDGTNICSMRIDWWKWDGFVRIGDL